MATWLTPKTDDGGDFAALVGNISDVVQALNTVLDVSLHILEVTKALSVGSIDPIANMVHALISELESLLNDLRQIGLYLTGDFEYEYPYAVFRGIL